MIAKTTYFISNFILIQDLDNLRSNVGTAMATFQLLKPEKLAL